MTLAPGVRLGPYEILGPLGAGGMGEVYRARDSRLGREVAVKVLPQHLSANPDIRTRFEREAKTVSSLNHPNICTLFDVGREGETDYLVMELVDGETLATRLLKGALTPPDVLKIGGQLADALDRAHRAGVIHRDLKPGNVMLTRSGAKLMDFGLARASVAGGPISGSGSTMATLTQQPTMASPLTAEGAIVGTFQYMAPEQLEGGEADARSDLWALGCVLYEMSTGRRAFDGRSQASLISAIMSSTPAPLSQVAPMSPPALERVVNACLSKDPADRIQSAHDVKLQLGWISEPGATSSIAGAPALPARAKGGSLMAIVALAIGALGLVAAALAGWALLHRETPTVVAQVPLPRDFTLLPFWGCMAISPDGNRVALSGGPPGRVRLWISNLGVADPVEVPGTEGGFPAWAPDGRSVAYFASMNKGLYRVPVPGGGPTRLADASDPRGLTWGSKGVIVYAPSASGPLLKVSASGGAAEPATALDESRGEASHRFPTFLPDGEHFLYVSLPAGPRGFRICVGSLSSKTGREILQAQSAATWVAPGYLVFVQAGKMTAQKFDLGKLAVVGEPFTIDDAPAVTAMDGERVVSASQNGRLLYPQNEPPDSRLEWLDRAGMTRQVVSLPTGDWALLALSPDQRSALASRDGDLWQVDLERAVPTRLLRGVDPTELAQWSPDGKRIAATSREGGREVLRILQAGGSGAQDSVPGVNALFVEAAAWAADGRSLVVAQLGAKSANANSWDVWTVPLDGGAPKAYLAGEAFERYVRLSPDGKWAACLVRAEGAMELFIDSYPVPGHKLQIFSNEPMRDRQFLWGAGGRELLYEDSEGTMLSLPLQFDGDQIHAGKPTKLFTIPQSVGQIDTRDGVRFLVNRESESTPGPSPRLVMGWTGLLKR